MKYHGIVTKQLVMKRKIQQVLGEDTLVVDVDDEGRVRVPRKLLCARETVPVVSAGRRIVLITICS